MKIAILQSYPWDLRPQWPHTPPVDVDDVRFQFGQAEDADYVVVLNGVGATTVVTCAPERIWAFVQEPPVPENAHIYRGQRAFHRFYAPTTASAVAGHIPNWGALNWHIGKSYDALVAEPYPVKSTDLSWVTSNLTLLPGHRKRMAFLDSLRRSGLSVSVWGRGLREIASKWDALAPSRYAIAFENFAGGIYWSEKLSDCFLAYATPFYYGATDIARYFPPKSYIAIDPDDPHVIDRMRDIVSSRFHEDNLPALLEARERCLNGYNTLIYIARQIKADTTPPSPPRRIRIRRLGTAPMPWPLRIDRFVRDLLRPLLPPAALAAYRRWRDSRRAS